MVEYTISNKISIYSIRKRADIGTKDIYRPFFLTLGSGFGALTLVYRYLWRWMHPVRSSLRLLRRDDLSAVAMACFSDRQRSHRLVPHLYLDDFWCIDHFTLISLSGTPSSRRRQMYLERVVFCLFNLVSLVMDDLFIGDRYLLWRQARASS